MFIPLKYYTLNDQRAYKQLPLCCIYSFMIARISLTCIGHPCYGIYNFISSLINPSRDYYGFERGFLFEKTSSPVTEGAHLTYMELIESRLYILIYR